jgi:hypothetical protein
MKQTTGAGEPADLETYERTRWGIFHDPNTNTTFEAKLGPDPWPAAGKPVFETAQQPGEAQRLGETYSPLHTVRTPRVASSVKLPEPITFDPTDGNTLAGLRAKHDKANRGGFGSDQVQAQMVMKTGLDIVDAGGRLPGPWLLEAKQEDVDPNADNPWDGLTTAESPFPVAFGMIEPRYWK